MHEIQLKRVYDPVLAEDGFRVLVDRIWPRGVSKEAASIDEWAKDIAPSGALRKWFAHDPARWEAFNERYREELRQHGDQLDRLRRRAAQGRVTLIFSARDTKRNQAVVLRHVLAEQR